MAWVTAPARRLPGVEAQNHYYGHSGAFARYLGLRRPRHVRGLVQHGWTAASPLETHFRDFPEIGASGGPRDRSLFVWSHASRAWDAAAAPRRSVPIGAPWLYLSASVGTPPAPGSGTVILPVHGIPTQRLHGDHATVAREWARTEGAATVCLYHVEAADERIVAAYEDAGHTCVTLGVRTDAAFLPRLYRLLTGAERVVSNRLSTPVVYAAALGVDVGVHGDVMRLDGEATDPSVRLRAVWPEFFDTSASAADRQAVARAEVGAGHLREPDELRHLLGWDRAWRGGPWWDHWVAAPAGRVVTNVRRRGAAAPASPAIPTTGPAAAAAPPPPPQSTLAWLRGAASYLPHPLGRAVDPSGVSPLAVRTSR